MVHISGEFFETCGTGTLAGKVADGIRRSEQAFGPMPIEVELVFQQTSTDWRRRHGGPSAWVAPEYAPMCFAQDLMWLRDEGYRVTVRETVVDPEEEQR